jgi:hypothetical protein
MKYLPHRWITMQKKKISTLQRCSEFTKCPIVDTCHHSGPKMARTQPVAMTTTSAEMVATPKT